ncbi:hypothetical protein, unlikely [Trypanosoma brucei gambiense DAL972]|uniref:Uncharacterized protein n=1 Tax=Trypanosoma brucei gambiense (strain MHOM/CI/86/DAL972) TaxID=679716 RepID=C9ZN23_TRYB9|nr:hypothetical protein, unlikely [Trypanosoma brucei gambiense DAL972]CBH10677.1 hypothetical protein, unlikely [Trypanosoma brucei gambiense DAL972]|eukprot:XP_011772965.1 hypothetical protein, unlikely [Trypanosoma brucei gambiense DAL972]
MLQILLRERHISFDFISTGMDIPLLLNVSLNSASPMFVSKLFANVLMSLSRRNVSTMGLCDDLSILSGLILLWECRYGLMCSELDVLRKSTAIFLYSSLWWEHCHPRRKACVPYGMYPSSCWVLHRSTRVLPPVQKEPPKS